MNQSFTKSKLLRFKNFESLVFDDFLSKTQKTSVFLQALNKKNHDIVMVFLLAEREGFEPPEVLPSTVFKTAAIDHSAISPGAKVQKKLFPTRKNIILSAIYCFCKPVMNSAVCSAFLCMSYLEKTTGNNAKS